MDALRARKEVFLACGLVAIAVTLAPSMRAHALSQALTVLIMVLVAMVWLDLLQPGASRKTQAKAKEEKPSRRTDGEAGEAKAGAKVNGRRIVSIYGFKVWVSDDSVVPLPLEAAGEEGVFPAPPSEETVSQQSSKDWEEEEMPRTLTRGFLHLEQRVHEASGKPEIRCVWLEAHEFSWEDLEVALEHLDRFCRHREAQQGFAVHYDFRQMEVQSVGALHRLLQFPSEPLRAARWRRLNISVKFVFSIGPAYGLAKSNLSSWLAMQPPLTRTILVSNPSDGNSICWDPAPQQEDQRGPAEDETEEQLDRYLTFVTLESG